MKRMTKAPLHLSVHDEDRLRPIAENESDYCSPNDLRKLFAEIDNLREIVATLEKGKKRKAKKVVLPDCPNCLRPHKTYEEDCTLHNLLSCLADRGYSDEEELRAIEQRINIDAFWDAVGEVLDNLEVGIYDCDE